MIQSHADYSTFVSNLYRTNSVVARDHAPTTFLLLSYSDCIREKIRFRLYRRESNHEKSVGGPGVIDGKSRQQNLV